MIINVCYTQYDISSFSSKLIIFHSYFEKIVLLLLNLFLLKLLYTLILLLHIFKSFLKAIFSVNSSAFRHTYTISFLYFLP